VDGRKADAHRWALLQQRKHGAHVHKALLGLAVHGAQEVERHAELQQQAVDHDEVSHSERARLNALRGDHARGGDGGAENRILAEVERGEGLLRLKRRRLIARQARVVAQLLQGLVAEVLYLSRVGNSR